jgi:hypothetical protein
MDRTVNIVPRAEGLVDITIEGVYPSQSNIQKSLEIAGNLCPTKIYLVELCNHSVASQGKLEAIKIVRSMMSRGLKEAKDLVDMASQDNPQEIVRGPSVGVTQFFELLEELRMFACVTKIAA